MWQTIVFILTWTTFHLVHSSPSFVQNVTVVRKGRQAATVTAASATKAEPVTIGSFRQFSNGIRSGDVILIDEKTIEIPDFSYDGQGPAAWFVVGNEGNWEQEFVELETTVLPSEKEGCSRLGRYSFDTVRVTLPGKLKVSDVSYLMVYCLRFNHNFGYVVIPDDAKPPAHSGSSGEVEECEGVEASEGGNSGGGRPGQSGSPPRTGGSGGNSGGGGLLGGLINGISNILG